MKLSVIRADYYSDGTIVPILITFSDESSEPISLVRSIHRIGAANECLIYCATPTRELTLHFSESKWKIVNVVQNTN